MFNAPNALIWLVNAPNALIWLVNAPNTGLWLANALNTGLWLVNGLLSLIWLVPRSVGMLSPLRMLSAPRARVSAPTWSPWSPSSWSWPRSPSPSCSWSRWGHVNLSSLRTQTIMNWIYFENSLITSMWRIKELMTSPSLKSQRVKSNRERQLGLWAVS